MRNDIWIYLDFKMFCFAQFDQQNVKENFLFKFLLFSSMTLLKQILTLLWLNS